MNNYPIIYHGSENSLDTDAYIIIPQPLSAAQSKALCESYTEINANLICVKDGCVVWSYKGVSDECNNSILSTYNLHQQHYKNPVQHKAQRQYALKMLRTIRGLLTYCTRTQYRVAVKKALQSASVEEKIKTLKSIDLRQISDFKKNSFIEVYKFLAFQMSQSLALLEDNEEIFTKNAAIAKYPVLKPYIDRVDCDVEQLSVFYEKFCIFLEKNIKKVEKQELYTTNFHGCVEVVDVQKEVTMAPVVVFDIDGTLLDETHREHLRLAGLWDEYFQACLQDTPIEHIIDLTHYFKSIGYEIWLMSGRSESILAKTKQSLTQCGVVYDYLKLRAVDNKTPDYVLKPGWISRLIGKERVKYVFDDTPAVIDGFRAKGLNVIDVTQLNTDNCLHLKEKLRQ